MNGFAVVFSQTLKKQLKGLFFWVVNGLFFIAVLLLFYLPPLLSQWREAPTVGMWDPEGQVLSLLQGQYEGTEAPYRLVELEGHRLQEAEELALSRIEDKEWKAYLLVSYNAQGLPKFTFKAPDVHHTDLLGDLRPDLQAAYSQLAASQAGLNEEQRQQLMRGIPLQVLALDAGIEDGESEAEKMGSMIGLSVFVTVVLYLLVVLYGNVVAYGVAGEKNSRVMELIISSIPPAQHFWGKVLAISLSGIIQILLLAAIGVGVGWSASQQFEAAGLLALARNIPPLYWVVAILFFILGYLLYNTVFAGLASLVTRLEEINQFLFPVTTVLGLVYISAYFAFFMPENPIIIALSYIPFFSPVLMFIRLGMEAAAWWEVWLSMLLLALAILLMGWFSAILYRGGVMIYGGRRRMREALRMARNEGS